MKTVHVRIDSTVDSTADRRRGYEFDDGPIKATSNIVLSPTYAFCLHTRPLCHRFANLSPHLHSSCPHHTPSARQRLLYLGLTRPTLGDLLVDEDTYEEESQGTDDAEDEDNTGLPGSPILALEELVHGILAAGEEGGIDCGHFALLRSKDSV
jgi:hypothetical protein